MCGTCNDDVDVDVDDDIVVDVDEVVSESVDAEVKLVAEGGRVSFCFHPRVKGPRPVFLDATLEGSSEEWKKDGRIEVQEKATHVMDSPRYSTLGQLSLWRKLKQAR